jgi:hypothetical protein
MLPVQVSRARCGTLVALTLLLAACDRPGVHLVQPGGAGSSTSALVLRAEISELTGASGEDLGWAAGVPDTEFTLLRVRDFQPIAQTDGVADPVGVASFEGVQSGLHWVTAFRRLESVEAEALPEEWPVAALAWGGKVSVSGLVDTSVALRPPRADGLVISEIHASTPPPWETNGSYYGGQYLELHNNGTVTRYLDGMLLGVAYHSFKDSSRSGHHSCVATAPVRADPEGIWTGYVLRFPGAGTEHAVAPGQTVVVAASASDHRDVHADLLDLTTADFEVRPVDLAFADNPAAPDLEDIGPQRFPPQMFLIGRPWFLASATELTALPSRLDPGHSAGLPVEATTLLRIPREQVVDVALVWWDNAGAYAPSGPRPICRDPVNPVFDAVPGGFLRSQEPHLSAQRRAVLARDGRVVLLDTDISALDFIRHSPTPGTIPQPGG